MLTRASRVRDDASQTTTIIALENRSDGRSAVQGLSVARPIGLEVKNRLPLEALSLHSIVVADPSSDRLGDGPSDFTITIRTTDMNGILYRLARVEI